MLRRDPREVLNAMFSGKTSRDDFELRSYLESVHPSVSWYPSAGLCFRDVLIWHWRDHLQHFSGSPSIFLHTDYAPDLLTQPYRREDGRTRIEVSVAAELLIARPMMLVPYLNRYHELADTRSMNRHAKLLNVSIVSDLLGAINARVLFCHFDNIDFLLIFSFCSGLPINNIFKLREGLGFGGGLTSMTFAYAFLGLLDCRCVVADREIHFERGLYEWHTQKFGPGPAVHVRRISNLGNFSGYRMYSYAVESLPNQLSDWDNAKQATDEISAGSVWRNWAERSSWG